MTDKRIENWIRPRKWDVISEMKRYAGLSARERGRHIDDLCALAAAILASRKDRPEVLRRQEPRPALAEAWWRELVRRAKEQARDKSD